VTWSEPTDQDLKEIIGSARNVAVVGASSDTSKPSYRVFNYLQEKTSFTLFPINPKEETIAGVKAFSALQEVPAPIDICVVFRRPEFMPEVFDAAISVGAKVLWMQLGIRNEDVAEKATNKGMKVVQDRCIKIEHARLFKVSESE
jgi:predicted CoA-binding protein